MEVLDLTSRLLADDEAACVGIAVFDVEYSEEAREDL